jgi:hypothetical protein
VFLSDLLAVLLIQSSSGLQHKPAQQLSTAMPQYDNDNAA